MLILKAKTIKFVNKRVNIADEVKIAKLNLHNTESLLKDCASIQVKQQKLIKQYKESLDEANQKLEKV